MCPPHHFYAMGPEDIRQRLYFRAEVLRLSIVTAADAQMDNIGMNFENPLHLFHKALIIFYQVPAAAAFHKGLQLHLFPLVPPKGPLPTVQGRKAPGPSADIL